MTNAKEIIAHKPTKSLKPTKRSTPTWETGLKEIWNCNYVRYHAPKGKEMLRAFIQSVLATQRTALIKRVELLEQKIAHLENLSAYIQIPQMGGGS